MLDARKYLGVPFRHQGRSPTVGLDCVGLAVLCLRDAGLKPADRADYGRDPDGTLETALRETLAGPFDDIRAGDIVLVEFAKREPRHVAVIADSPFGLSMIHADSSRGKVVEHLIDSRWRERIVSAWRLA